MDTQSDGQVPAELVEERTRKASAKEKFAGERARLSHVCASQITAVATTEERLQNDAASRFDDFDE